MSMATLADVLSIWESFELKVEVDVYIFANSLLGTTIQDGDMSKRSNGQVVYLLRFISTKCILLI